MSRSALSLDALARAAVHRDRPVVLVGGEPVALGPRPPIPHWTDVHGIRCGTSVDAIGFPFGWSERSARPFAVAIDRRDRPLLLDPDRPRPLRIDDPESLVLDAARRTLGLPTPEPSASTLDLSDAVWLDRLLAATLDFPLGEPPTWPILASLHPLADGSTTAEGLRHRRHQLCGDWSRFHEAATESGVGWAGVSTSLAAWFDAGSLSRWLFAALADPREMLTELGELLRPEDFAQVEHCVALSEP